MSKQVSALLDLGNSRYKWLYRDESLATHFDARPYPKEHVAVQIAADVLRDRAVNLVTVCSVRDESLNQALEAEFQRLGVQVNFATVPKVPLFTLGYENPETLGVDRYCLLLAVRDTGAIPAVVVSAGTAVTVDALDASGNHLGGVIFPGLELQRKSLNQGASLISTDSYESPQVFGSSTGRCIAGGTLFGVVATILYFVDTMRQKLGSSASVVITGGDAMMLSQYLPDEYEVDEILLFKGLGQLS